MKTTITKAAIARHLPRRYVFRTIDSAKPVSAQLVAQMIRNLDAGKNRERINAALLACGLTDDAAKKFLEAHEKAEK